MPTGKVKFFDAERGFGFLTSDDGEDVFLPSKSLPEGVTTLRGGTRVEFGVMEGRRGRTALSLKVVEPVASVVKAKRKPADEMADIVETLIKLLDDVGNELRRGRYPADPKAQRVAVLLRAVADGLDV